MAAPAAHAATSDGTAVVTVEGAVGAPAFPTQSHVYDQAAGAAVSVRTAAYDEVVVEARSVSAPDFTLSWYPGGDVSVTTYSSFTLTSSEAPYPSCTPYEQALDVQEVAYDSGGALVTLAASYLMRCTAGGPPVMGVIRWHSDLPYAAVTVTPPAFDFPVKTGGTTPLVVPYRNRGTTTVTLNDATLLPAVEGGTTSGWSLTSNGCAAAVLTPGQECTATVAASPVTLGRKQVVVSFGDDTTLAQHARVLTVYAVQPPTAAPAAHVQNAGRRGVSLEWSSTAPATTAPAAWEVYRKVGSDTYRLVARRRVLSSGTYRTGAWTDSDLHSGLRYYLVRGVNPAGNGPFSAALKVLYGPQVPTGLVAAGLTHRVVLNWLPPGGFFFEPLSGYAVSRVTSTGSLVRIATQPVGGLSTTADPTHPLHVFALSGLASGQKVTLAVQALYGAVVGPAQRVSATATSTDLLYVRGGSLLARGVSGGQPVRVDLAQTFDYQRDMKNLSPPAFYPGRRWVVCNVQAGSGSPRLVVRRTDGTGTSRFLTPDTIRAFSPDVSRDGKWVAFTRQAADLHTYLYRVPWSGGTPVLIPNSKDLDEPSWSPDGKSLYASRIADATRGVVRLTLGGTRKTIGTGPNESPVVSPDGRSVAFLTRGTSSVSSLKVLTIATGAIRTLVANTGGRAWRPSWTPDSSTVYVTANSLSTGANFLRRIRRDGTGLTTLASLGSGGQFVVYEAW